MYVCMYVRVGERESGSVLVRGSQCCVVAKSCQGRVLFIIGLRDGTGRGGGTRDGGGTNEKRSSVGAAAVK